MTDQPERVTALSKVPAITLGFWIIKILATTLGETGGDTVTMSWLGETTDAPGPQRLSGRYGDLRRRAGGAGLGADPGAAVQPVALLGDDRRLDHVRHDSGRLCDRSLGIGYPGGSLLLLACVLGSLFAWHRTLGHGRRQYDLDPEGRGLLLDHDHLLADARHRAGRLGRGRDSDGGWGLGYGGAPCFSAQRWHCSRSSISRRG